MDQLLYILFYTTIVIFTVASTLLAAYSVQNKLRLRNVRLSWRGGKMMGYPLFSTVFLIIVSILSIVVLSIEDAVRYPIMLAYFWIGGMWFISSYLASKYYLTDYGIVKNINEPAQTIPWFQILDYVEKELNTETEYIFTYSDLDESLVSGYKKLNLKVPERKKNAVKKIVSLKLENRFKDHALPDIDIKRIQEE